MSRYGWHEGGWWEMASRLPSPNQGDRPPGVSVSLVVLHNISLPPGEFSGKWVEDFFLNQLPLQHHLYFREIGHLQVSAHFYVRRDGRLLQFVGVDRRAWHAGRSEWEGRENCNDYSVGIELEGADEIPYTALQYAVLWQLLKGLCERYPIKAVAGHCHVAPGRKTDPGPAFDWAALHFRFPVLALPSEVLP